MREQLPRTSLPSTGGAPRFRVEFYDCVYTRADPLFELTDAVRCADGPAKTLF
jgi:hypothetical protein